MAHQATRFRWQWIDKEVWAHNYRGYVTFKCGLNGWYAYTEDDFLLLSVPYAERSHHPRPVLVATTKRGVTRLIDNKVEAASIAGRENG